VSADSASMLRQKLAQVAGLLSDVDAEHQTAAVCQELAARDHGAPFRAAVAVSEPGELMEAVLRRRREPGAEPPKPRPRLVFVCPGQGGQWLGMGRTLLNVEPAFRQEIHACDALIRERCGWSLIDELLASPEQSRLGQQDVAQLAIFSMSVALGALW